MNNEKTKGVKVIRKVKNVVAIFMILVLNFLGGMNCIYAASILENGGVNVHAVEDCGTLLTYKGGIVITDYVEYTNNRRVISSILYG